jgi:endonuclease I
MTTAQRKMFNAWAQADLTDDWERLRNKRIAAAQGNRNPQIK